MPSQSRLERRAVPFLTTQRVLRISFIFLLASASSAFAQSTSSPTSATSGTPYRVLRSIAGAAGHEDNGKFMMDDARSLFNAGKDAKVIVYFEWEGPLGPHHFEGLWKSPEGKIVLISDFRYEAKSSHYSGYWTMLLSDGTPSGEWNLEARIDGEPAGTLSFVITGSPVAHAPAPPQPLSLAALYRKAVDSTVIIEKLTPDGTPVEKSTGFWIADGQILTSFESIDGAVALRISPTSGGQIRTDQVLAWNRWQDWAVLKVDGSAKATLKRSANAAANVGDRCVFLEWGAVGSKLTDGSISGTNSFPRAGSRLLVSSGVSSQSIGGALLDEFGNYVGVIGGSIVPSANPIRILYLLNDSGNSNAAPDFDTTGLAVPNSLLPDLPLNAAPPTSLAELSNRGEFAPLVVKSNSVQYMSVTSAVAKDSGNIPVPRNTKQVFSKRDNKAAVYVNWQSSAKEKINCFLQFFSADNKMIFASKPQDLSLGPGKYSSTTWDVPLAPLSPGIYRIDLFINGKTSWREFIRVTE
jgi:S1-C subfamily serine protease